MPDNGAILLTGGLGYVGGRIASHLIKKAPDLPLRLLTRKNPQEAPAWARELNVVQGDVLDKGSLTEALRGIDTVVHLAAVDEVVSQSNPNLALEVNGRGTYEILRACKEIGVRRFVYFSTFHVYGPGAKQPITEGTLTQPVHPYSITHRLAEDYVNWFRRDHGLETLVLRLSNGYGHPADSQARRWTLVFNDLCLQAVRSGELRLRSKGTQQRDFISLTDVARSIQHLLGLSSKIWGDGLFNLGGNCSMSIMEVAKAVAAEYQQCYGREIPIQTGDAEDPQVTGPVLFNIDKLKKTGFTVTGNMSQEVQGTFEICEELVRSGQGIT